MMSSSEDGAQAPKRRRTSRKLVEAIFQDTVSLAEMHADVMKITEITSDNRFTIQKENREISTYIFRLPLVCRDGGASSKQISYEEHVQGGRQCSKKADGPYAKHTSQ